MFHRKKHCKSVPGSVGAGRIPKAFGTGTMGPVPKTFGVVLDLLCLHPRYLSGILLYQDKRKGKKQ